MTTRDSLLAYVLEHPDDDAARFVFADWLEENGDGPRAEFIRVQIESARCPTDDARHQELEHRAQKLLAEFGKQWLHEIPGWSRGDVRFERGFVAHVGATARAFAKGAAALFRRAPIRSVTLRSTTDAQLLDIVAAGGLANIQGLNLSRNLLTDSSLVPMLSSPNLGTLTSLDLGSNRFTNDTIRALAQSPQLRGLTKLEPVHPLGPGALLAGQVSRNWNRNLGAATFSTRAPSSYFDRAALGP